MMWSTRTIQLIQQALEEDLDPAGDITSQLLPDPAAEATARLVARREGVVCGLALAPEICRVFAEHLEQPIRFAIAQTADGPLHDGSTIRSGDSLATLHGPRAALLAVERTLLNFVGRMSGVASLTQRFVQAARSGRSDARVLDTRKTVPGWRELDKYAVRCGGGENHRFGLHDAILIKDNHLAGVSTNRLAAYLFELLNRAPQRRSPGSPEREPGAPGAASASVGNGVAFVEVEVDSLDQFAETLKVVGIDVILLDNFSNEQMRTAVAQRDRAGLRGKLELEASGGVTLESVQSIAATGVERISVGALTHSAATLDVGLDF